MDSRCIANPHFQCEIFDSAFISTQKQLLQKFGGNPFSAKLLHNCYVCDISLIKRLQQSAISCQYFLFICNQIDRLFLTQCIFKSFSPASCRKRLVILNSG